MDPAPPTPLDYRRPDPSPLTLDYRPPRPRRHRVGAWVAAALATLVVLSAAAALILPSGNGSGYSPRAKCVTNEHLIGLCILLYQQDHGGHYPESLAAILSAEQVGPEVLVCPDSTDNPAVLPPPPPGEDRPTTRQATVALAVPGHVSYVYCGHPDWTDANVPADAVVLYEPLADHGGFGCNMLFGDGHADWEPAPRATRLIAAASATTRPVSAASVP